MSGRTAKREEVSERGTSRGRQAGRERAAQAETYSTLHTPTAELQQNHEPPAVSTGGVIQCALPLPAAVTVPGTCMTMHQTNNPTVYTWCVYIYIPILPLDCYCNSEVNSQY